MVSLPTLDADEIPAESRPGRKEKGQGNEAYVGCVPLSREEEMRDVQIEQMIDDGKYYAYPWQDQRGGSCTMSS